MLLCADAIFRDIKNSERIAVAARSATSKINLLSIQQNEYLQFLMTVFKGAGVTFISERIIQNLRQNISIY